MRLDEGMFNDILERIRPRITGIITNWRQPIEPGLKLAITLRFLATGDSYPSLALLFRVSRSKVGKCIKETCTAILNEYMHEMIKLPTTQDGWKEIARGFADRWNFDHVIGALDGKHIRIQAPPRSGSYYFNYKGYFSIVLLALVDANYKFIYVSAGANGATNDAQVFFYSNLYRAFSQNLLNLPHMESLPGEERRIPYFIVGNDAFGLKTWLMKPYPSRGRSREERIYNYLLSRARRVVENAFGFLAQR